MAKKSVRDIKFEIDFFEKVVANAPDFIEALVCLGDLYTKKGAYEKGLRVDERLARLRPDDAGILYNLACSYSLMKDIPMARGTMVRAIGHGYDEWDQLLKDQDLKGLLRDSEFQSFLNECLSRRPCKAEALDKG